MKKEKTFFFAVVWSGFFLCLLHSKYNWMTKRSSPHKIWSKNALLQDAAFSNKSERA